jgi:hypothetical protein
MTTLRAQKGRDVSLIPALTDQLFLMDPYPTYEQLHAQGVSGWDEDRQRRFCATTAPCRSAPG